MSANFNVMNFGSSEKLLRFVQEKSDDIEKAVVYCHDRIEITLPGRMPQVCPTANIGMILYFPTSGPIAITKGDAALVLNDGILNRMGIRIEIV
jgi:hypothetical protein